ncbi:hypothetical protein DENSPDRAFT_845839 [Dentipellis sp. KUC8613]|nr:hypothetical protein DENSPDRAFT_845839 [Dentipellis sp. KUC8613]
MAVQSNVPSLFFRTSQPRDMSSSSEVHGRHTIRKLPFGIVKENRQRKFLLCIYDAVSGIYVYGNNR